MEAAIGWGDELMLTGQAREAQARDPRKVRILYERERYHEAWYHNPRIARPPDGGEFQRLYGRVNGLRPYMEAKEEWRYRWKPYRPPVGELYFTSLEKDFGELHPKRVVVEPNVKAGACSNKDWGWQRWVQLCRLLAERGIQITQLGPSSAQALPGVEFVVTQNVRLAAAVLAQARAAVIPEGALHHVCAAVSCPAVVIYGGFISPEVTGYDGQVAFYTGEGLGCGSRKPCGHCRCCMDRIEPEEVAGQLEVLL